MSYRQLSLFLPLLAAAALVAALSVPLGARQSAAGLHNERIAGNRAEEFSWALSRNPAFAYELLDARYRSQTSPVEFVTTASAIFQPESATVLRATHFSAIPAQRAMDIYLISSQGRYFRFRMTGSAAQGYRVGHFAATNAPDPAARPLRPDTGPYDLYAATSANPRVTFVPIAADLAIVSALAHTFRERLQLDVRLQPPQVPSARAVDPERGQLVGEVLANELVPQCRERGTGVTPYVIGVTGKDMYLQTKPAWRFAFSYRLRDCVAVVSYARMGGVAEDADLVHARLRKMTAKNLGVLVYGLPLSKDPRSVMFDEILGIDELDFIEDSVERAGMAPRHLW